MLYPSMYFGLERQLTKKGDVIKNTTYSVNNVYLNGVRIAALTPDGDVRFYSTDQVDSVSMVLSEQGKPLTSFEYMPYGETWIERIKPELKEKHNPKYNSQELDTETDFYYYNARYYDPEISRFVTADTVIDGEEFDKDGKIVKSDPAGWNRYMYVKGNPVLYKDPTGKNLGVAVNSKSVLGTGHMAMYIATKGENGEEEFHFFEWSAPLKL